MGMLGVDGLRVRLGPQGVGGPLDTGDTGMALARMERARCFADFSSSISPTPLPASGCRLPSTFGLAPIASYFFFSSATTPTPPVLDSVEGAFPAVEAPLLSSSFKDPGWGAGGSCFCTAGVLSAAFPSVAWPPGVDLEEEAGCPWVCGREEG